MKREKACKGKPEEKVKRENKKKEKAVKKSLKLRIKVG